MGTITEENEFANTVGGVKNGSKQFQLKMKRGVNGKKSNAVNFADDGFPEPSESFYKDLEADDAFEEFHGGGGKASIDDSGHIKHFPTNACGVIVEDSRRTLRAVKPKFVRYISNPAIRNLIFFLHFRF